MSGVEIKCGWEQDRVDNERKKEDKKEVPPQKNLKTTTETSTFFFLSKFNAKDISFEERLPKNFKDLEQLLNKILTSLEETENVFLNQAKEVLDRDLILINWRLKLKNIQRNLKEKEQDFERIDQTVQCFLRVSCHIDKILGKLEMELPGPSLINNAFKYSPTRICMYNAMTKINIRQKDILQQISNAALLINEAVERNPLNPVEQFTRILGLHMEVLRTIERRAGQVEEQLSVVKALQKFYMNSKKPIMCDYYY